MPNSGTRCQAAGFAGGRSRETAHQRASDLQEVLLLCGYGVTNR
jgi:hypothetical protein